MNNKKILGIRIENYSKEKILEKIVNYLKNPKDFFQIVSLNPENLIIAQENRKFKEVIETAQIKIIDGIGIVIANFLLNGELLSRTSGVDLMLDLLKIAHKKRLRVMFLGGGLKVADKVVECQKEKFSKAIFFSFQGIKNIKNPKKEEEEKIFSIVSAFKPHFLFVAFGSPDQELWLDCHQEKLKGIVCMGVGGAFDYLAGAVPRAPKIIRFLGLEWLFRLIIQPWRWRRQIRLIKFGWLIFLALFINIINKMSFVSLRTVFRVLSGIMVNLVSGWLGLLTAPWAVGIISFEKYRQLLTVYGIFAILGLLIALWLEEKSKSL